ncbi:MAG TPA: hypothetical protein PKD79_00185 [Candidatus Doudnabacteria bacterium]|nr:hypothetical protein [Candidatus Doudnabacteria bacterium]
MSRGRREKGGSSFVRDAGIDMVATTRSTQNSSKAFIVVEGLTEADIDEIVTCKHRLDPEELDRIYNDEIHRSFGACK